MTHPDQPLLQLGPFAGRVGGALPSAPAADTTALRFHLHGLGNNLRPLSRALGRAAEAPALELLQQGWQRWGTGLFARLDGVLAIAVQEGSRCWLHVDRGGLSRLYWQCGEGGSLLFATDLQRLAALPGAQRTLARRSVHEYLRLLDVAVPHTLLDGVDAVEPGQWIEFKAGEQVATGEVPLAGAAFPGSLDEAVTALGECLATSVGEGLAGAARPAAFLSGGTDSALLCALGARLRPDLVALTVGFDGAAFDESPVAAHIASHLGLRHEVMRFDRAALLGALERMGRSMDHLSADPAIPATVLAFDAARERFDAVLDGTGADEALGAMPPRHTRVAIEWADRLPAPLRQGLATLLPRLPHALARYAPIVSYEHPADLLTRWHGFSQAQITELCGEPVSLAHTRLHSTFARYPRAAHFERFSALVDAMPCERLTQALAMTGAPLRFPFLQRDVDGFLRQLRTDFRHAPGEPKRILRALLARHVPRSILDQPKHGFDFPLNEFLEGEDFALVRRHLTARRWADGPLRGEVVERYGREYIGGQRRHAFRVWALVLLSVWLTGQGLG